MARAFTFRCSLFQFRSIPPPPSFLKNSRATAAPVICLKVPEIRPAPPCPRPTDSYRRLNLSGPCFLVAWVAETLPVGLIPEQIIIALTGNDMIRHIDRCDPSMAFTLGAQRMSCLMQCGRFSPAGAHLPFSRLHAPTLPIIRLTIRLGMLGTKPLVGQFWTSRAVAGMKGLDGHASPLDNFSVQRIHTGRKPISSDLENAS